MSAAAEIARDVLVPTQRPTRLVTLICHFLVQHLLHFQHLRTTLRHVLREGFLVLITHRTPNPFMLVLVALKILRRATRTKWFLVFPQLLYRCVELHKLVVVLGR
mgnify:CR=1 FL=1